MKDTVKILNDLIKISKDGELGFLQAADHVQDQELKSLFQEKATGCRHAIHVLQNHISDLSGEPMDTGSMLGAVHRGWINVKSMVTGHDDHAILVECARGEDAAQKTYEEALKEDLPANLRDVIQHQCNEVQANHALIKSLCDRYALAI